MTIFNKKRLASIESQYNGYYYGAGGYKVVQQRDANLQNLRGSAASVNRTEMAMQVFADPEVVLGWERFLSLLSSFTYSVTCENAEAKAFLEDQIFSNWGTIYKGLAVSRVTGIAGLEKIFSVNEKNQIILENLLPFDTSRIIYSLPQDSYNYELRLSTSKAPYEGELIPEYNFIIHKHYSVMIDNSYGLGIGGLLAEIILCKSKLLNLWHKIVEKYSEPIVAIEVPDSASDEEIDEFFEALKALKNGARFVMPEGFKFNVHNVSATGLSDLILPLIDRLDRSIMSLLVGESLTGKETANGSNARDITARDISLQKAFEFAEEICHTVTNQLIRQLLIYNFPKVDAKLAVSSPENLNELLDMYTKAKQLGLDIDRQWLADKLGIKLAPPKKTLGTAV